MLKFDQYANSDIVEGPLVQISQKLCVCVCVSIYVIRTVSRNGSLNSVRIKASVYGSA